MKTIRTKVYQFSELSDTAKQNAIQWFLSSWNDSTAWEDTKEDAKDIGLKLISGGEGEFMLSANEVAANIFRDHGENCDTYKTAEAFMKEWEPAFSKYVEDEEGETALMDIEDQFLNDLIADYRRMYDDQIEYEYSDEYAIDMIDANEYDFTKDGKRFNQ